MQNILGYHCNEKQLCVKFVNSGKMIICVNDKYWLGEGMYFWDNLSNAKYWKVQKAKKQPCCEHAIVKASISLEKMLDLTDKETLSLVLQCWEKHNIAYSKNVKIIEHGKIVDFFTKKYSNIVDCDVVKCCGYYGYNNTKKTPHLTDQAKIIYNVKSESAILGDRILIKDS